MQRAVTVGLGFAVAVMLVVWFAFERRRFRGPPVAPLKD